jgi:hypothetical protein
LFGRESISLLLNCYRIIPDEIRGCRGERYQRSVEGGKTHIDREVDAFSQLMKDGKELWSYKTGCCLKYQHQVHA